MIRRNCEGGSEFVTDHEVFEAAQFEMRIADFPVLALVGHR
jgi:hypothetical protein